MYSLLEVLVGGDGDSYLERDALDGAEAASGRDDARSTLMLVCDGGAAVPHGDMNAHVVLIERSVAMYHYFDARSQFALC